ncbi:MAG: hypothetical protein ABR954_02475 [Dehalococcoidales bacterium]
MRLFTYIVARDYGFAPNPFYGYCTLATCKPLIRSRATIGDWVIGTGAKIKYDLSGYLIYAMKVDEIMDYDSYWNDQRFSYKRPLLNGSLKQLYGDNIYHRQNNVWIQHNSHHSLEDGKPNINNVTRDTSVNQLLISREFVYYGSAAIKIPKQFRPYRPTNENLCCLRQGHMKLSEKLASAFESWLSNRDEWGLQGMPLEFDTHKPIH